MLARVPEFQSITSSSHGVWGSMYYWLPGSSLLWIRCHLQFQIPNTSPDLFHALVFLWDVQSYQLVIIDQDFRIHICLAYPLTRLMQMCLGHFFFWPICGARVQTLVTSVSKKNCDNPQCCITTMDCHSFFETDVSNILKCQTLLPKDKADRDPYYHIFFVSFTWADLAAFHKSDKI